MNISLQLWSIKEEVKADFPSALELVQKAGYQGVEFAGYFGRTPDQMNDLLNKYNLKAVSAHVGIPKLKESLEAELEYAKALNFNLIVCPVIKVESKEQIIEDAKFLESCAQRAAKEGITIGFHNHAREFEKFDDVYVMDIILENAPSIKFQADLYWIAVAGLDPVEYITPLAKAGRMCSIHAKELAKEGKENVYIGEGKIDFKAVAKICPPEKIPYIVEQEEYSSDHFDGITRSYQSLRKILENV